MSKLKVLLGDLGYYNKFTRQTNYIPLNIGYIAQYALSQFEADIDISLFKDPIKILKHAEECEPDIVGLSLYYWNTDLNHAFVRRLRALYGDDLIIVLGGPSVGIDRQELVGLFRRFPEVDAFVINEGELGFSNILKSRLSNTGDMWSNPIDGVVFRRDWKLNSKSDQESDDNLCIGRPVGLTLDLSTLPSPYLSGILDEFLDGEYLPMIQSSRLCPYTCAFCVSGKNKGKLRAFPIDQVKSEIELICHRFSDRPYMPFLLSDENFGILKRDVELAEFIMETKKKTGYPKSIFFYNDKRFTETSKQVIESLGEINMHGLILSLQTENPEALKAVKRKNLSSKAISAAIKWAVDRNMSTSTELIFGLPYETRESFIALYKSCVDKGFDSILGFNLFLMDGIELNTPSQRRQHQIKTMFRPVGTYYGELSGEFIAETEEIVTSAKYFSFEDYLVIRSLNFMYYSVFALNFYRWFFQYIRHCGIDMSKFMIEFIAPEAGLDSLSTRHIDFTKEIHNAFKNELFETRADVKAHLKKIYQENNGKVIEPIRHNVYYGSRMIYLENDWVSDTLLATLKKFLPADADDVVLKNAEFILQLCSQERVSLRADAVPEPMLVSYDIVKWREDKFKGPLTNYPIKPARLGFSIGSDTVERMTSFRKEFANYPDKDFYYEAMDFMSRRELIYMLDMSSVS